MLLGRFEWTAVIQIIGETSTGDMLNVNPTKSKELTNFRNKGKEDHIVLQVCLRSLRFLSLRDANLAVLHFSFAVLEVAFISRIVTIPPA